MLSILHTLNQATRTLRAILLVATCIIAPALAQSAGGAALDGIVRDSRSRPVSGASVTLKPSTGKSLTVRSDAEGRYGFNALPLGNYVLSAEMPGTGKAVAQVWVSAKTPSQHVDLALTSPSLPDFSDDPKFTVAGVTDASSAGSHGSSASAPTVEALARATVALGAASSPNHGADAKVLQEAADRQPDSFDPNRDAGLALTREGQWQEAEPYLQRAAKLDGPKEQQAEIHRTLGEALEKSNQPLPAVLEYQKAAELEPSEENLFAWGSELLLHRAIAPSIEVFSKGHRIYPKSSRTLLGLAAAYYSQASYDEAARLLCEASDLDPANPNPYLFMGKMVSVQAIKSDAVVERLRRFSASRPDDAQANYLFALALWQQRGSAQREQVRKLLEHSIGIEPTYAAYLQLGIVDSQSGEFQKAVANLQRATQLDTRAPEAHYRLALAYQRTGDKRRADEQLTLYNQSSKEASLEQDRERRAIQQYVFSLQTPTTQAPK